MAGIQLHRRTLPTRRRYAVRLSGGAYGFGPASANFILGQDFDLRLTHRPLDGSAQYLVAFGDNNAHVAIIRGFVAGKYELYAQAGGQLIRVTLPTAVAVGSLNQVRFVYAGGTLQGYLNGALLYDQPASFVPPASATGLRIGTVDPEGITDYGDYAQVALYKAGVQVFEYNFTEGSGPTAAETLGRYAPIISTAGAATWPWVPA